MAKPVNEKCLNCALSLPSPVRQDQKPPCWDLKVCPRRRGHYRDLEASRQKQRARHRYLRLAGDKCALCSSTEKLEAHHIVSQRQGGKDTPDNVLTLCHTCHVVVEAYRRWTQFRGNLTGPSTRNTLVLVPQDDPGHTKSSEE